MKKSMEIATKKHNEAMGLADTADRLTRDAKQLYLEAFRAESEAADAVSVEPSHSVLCRSAASLAFQAEEFSESLKYANAGLAGNPPPEIAEELREVRAEAMAFMEVPNA